jgi:thioredoxin reductase (NADPH)
MSGAQKAGFDVLIIGGGPAGMSAAIWCADLGMSAALIEQNDTLGGQLLIIHNPITNYPGFLRITGAELAAKMAEQVDRAGVPAFTGSTIIKINTDDRSVTLEDERTLIGRAMIMATGVRRRKLGIGGEEKLAGKGILSSGALEHSKVRGKSVLIVGGGDAALENALILSESASSVTVIHRGARFSAREDFVREANKRNNVSFLFNTAVLEFLGEDSLSAAAVKTDGDRDRRVISGDFALIRIGVEPNTNLPGLDETLTGRYIETGSSGDTTLPFVFAAGDVASKISPTIATAVGMGATAAKNVCELLRETAK